VKQRFNGILITAILVVSSVAGFGQKPSQDARASTAKPGDKAIAGEPAKVVKVEDIEKDIAEALTLIERNYGGTKALNYNDLFKTSIDSMLHTLDPHSNYFDAKEFEEFRTDQSSRYFGIGATIGDLSDADGKVIATYIKATFDGAPANRAGLRYGDKIVEVNGTSMLGKSFSDVRTFLRGPRGTSAKIVVERLATGKRETVDIIRDAVSQPSISEYYMIRPGVGYLAMRGGFNQTTYAEFANAMRELRAQGMQQVVIDLRDNGGGLVSQAYRVANSFLQSGQTVFTQKGRIDGVTEPYRAENSSPDRSPVVVLVNRNTASASEILAGALQDHDRALIVGENTFGKGLVQNPFQLEYGSMLLLTIAKYETPSGRLIQRDYSNGNLYDYYTEGGSFRDITADPEKPKGVESKTDAGRAVYSGGGINPDVPIKPQTIPIERARFQAKLANPIFAFSLDLVTGKVKGFETYKVDKPIIFDYDLKKTDFPVTEPLIESFKKFAADKYKFTGPQIDKEREFVERTLRTELVTAAYGSQTSGQVFNEYDDQLLRAIELIPQAKQLAAESAKITAAKKREPANR
jgi:carboxyl-terminal processing protease